MIRITKKHYTILSIFALVVLVTPHIALADWSPIQDALYLLVVNLFGLLVRIGGALLDYSIDNFVLGFGATFAHSGIGVAVNNGWVVIRDSVNLFFIFGLVYIGIKMILDSDNSNTRRWLANLILAALLINFSLFTTKMVIDFSNQISAEIAVAGLGATANGDGTYKSDVSGNMMQQLNLSNAFQLASKPAGAGYGYIFGLAILFMITAFVFGAGGILLIIRFAVLNLYLVFSAVMFMSWVLPGLSDTMNQYWKGFLKRVFFAPIFFLFLYFAFQMVGELQKTVKGGLATSQSIAGALGGEANGTAANIQDATLGTMPFFFLVCIFMIIALLAAQKIGADGAGKAVSIGKSWGNKVRSGVQKGAGGATTGLAARGLRNTAGRAAYEYAQSDKAKDRASRSYLGKIGYQASKRLGESSFDARQVGGVGKNLGVGEGVKGGFAKRIKDADEAEKKFKKELGYNDLNDPKNKARAAEKAQKIKDDADRQKTLAEGGKQGFEESIRTSSVQFKQGMDELSKELEGLESALRDKVTAGTVTDKEKSDAEKVILDKQVELAKKREALGAIERVKMVKNESIAADNSLMTYYGTDEVEKTRLRDAAQKAKAAWQNQIKEEREAFDAKAKSAEETRKNADKQAEAEIKYERQIARNDYIVQSKSRWDMAATKLGSTGLGGGAGLTGASVAGSMVGLLGGAGYGLVAGGAAASVAGAKSYELQKMISSFEKEYGKGGLKALDNDRKKERAKEQVTALKELDGESEKKGVGADKDGDKK